MQLRHRGFNLHSLRLRAASEGCHLWDHICPQTSLPQYRQVHDLSSANRKNWVENIFDCNPPCETSLGKWPMGNTKMCRQSSGQRLWYYWLGSQWPMCSVFVSRSFPAQACTFAVWDVILLLDYFDPWTFAAVYQMMRLLVLAWCFSASKHGMVGGCKASLHFYATFTPL